MKSRRKKRPLTTAEINRVSGEESSYIQSLVVEILSGLPKGSEFIGNGRYNIAIKIPPGNKLIKGASFDGPWAFKAQIDFQFEDKENTFSDDQLDTPMRTERLTKQINPSIADKVALHKANFKGGSVSGIVMPFISGRQATDQEMARAVYNIYLSTGRILLDAFSAGNIIQTESGTVCVDVGLALQRRQSIVSEQCWSANQALYTPWLKKWETKYPETISTAQGLLFLERTEDNCEQFDRKTLTPASIQDLGKLSQNLDSKTHQKQTQLIEHKTLVQLTLIIGPEEVNQLIESIGYSNLKELTLLVTDENIARLAQLLGCRKLDQFRQLIGCEKLAQLIENFFNGNDQQDMHDELSDEKKLKTIVHHLQNACNYLVWLQANPPCPTFRWQVCRTGAATETTDTIRYKEAVINTPNNYKAITWHYLTGNDGYHSSTTAEKHSRHHFFRLQGNCNFLVNEKWSLKYIMHTQEMNLILKYLSIASIGMAIAASYDTDIPLFSGLLNAMRPALGRLGAASLTSASTILGLFTARNALAITPARFEEGLARRS